MCVVGPVRVWAFVRELNSTPRVVAIFAHPLRVEVQIRVRTLRYTLLFLLISLLLRSLAISALSLTSPRQLCTETPRLPV